MGKCGEQIEFSFRVLSENKNVNLRILGIALGGVTTNEIVKKLIDILLDTEFGNIGGWKRGQSGTVFENIFKMLEPNQYRNVPASEFSEEVIEISKVKVEQLKIIASKVGMTPSEVVSALVNSTVYLLKPLLSLNECSCFVVADKQMDYFNESQVDIWCQMLINYINSLSSFEMVDEVDTYTHMGAIIIDAVLQQGISYKVVKAKVERLLREYPNAETTSEFQKVIEQVGSVSELIVWKDGRKPQAIAKLVSLLLQEKIETDVELKEWLFEPKNGDKLKSIKGIGDKTYDYLKILVGHSESAVDIHLKNFVHNAGIQEDSYKGVQAIINRTADLMGVRREILDHSIWTYMSGIK